jgi:2-alkenal reductase
MMKSVKKLPLTFLVLLAFGVTACSRTPAVTGEATPLPAVDTTEISAQVMEQVRAEMATAEAVEAAKAVEIVEAVEVAAETAVSTIEDTAVEQSDLIAGLVQEQVDAYLEQAQAELVVEQKTPVTDFAGNDFEASLINVYQLANPAVVFIITSPRGSGSGFVYSQDGHIVTNNHVARGGSRYEIVFAGGERMRGTLVGTDTDSDLAVLQVDELPQGIHPLPLADSDAVQVGQLAVAIGNPFGEQGSMSLGIISGLGRSLESERRLESGSSYSLPQVIQTDTPINPGNSGGPLLNLSGEVVGISTAILTTTGLNSGVGFAIPVNAVRRIVPSLISQGSYDYPYMGAGFDGEISLSEQSTFGLSQTQGAYLLSVTPDGPADEAGLIAANQTTGRGGDLIVAIDGQAINDFGDLNSYLVFKTTVDQTIELTIVRDDQTMTLPLTLGVRP